MQLMEGGFSLLNAGFSLDAATEEAECVTYCVIESAPFGIHYHMPSDFGHFWVSFGKFLNVGHFFDVCPIRSGAKDCSEDTTTSCIGTGEQCTHGLRYPGY